MRFMIIVHSGNRKMLADGKFPPNMLEMMQEMGKFNEKLAAAGIMETADGLVPGTKGTRLYFPGAARRLR